MDETEYELSRHRRSDMNALMNQRLASAVDLQMQIKQAHWNVKGQNFCGPHGLHELFDKVSRSVEFYVDLIAERIVQLGGVAQGTVRASAALTLLHEYPHLITDGMAHVGAVAKALSTFGDDARRAINEAMKLADAVTAHLFATIARGIDQWLRFIEAHSRIAK